MFIIGDFVEWLFKNKKELKNNLVDQKKNELNLEVVVVHYNNGKKYVITNENVNIQIKGKWVPAVQYVSLTDRNGGSFVRSRENFIRSFKNENSNNLLIEDIVKGI